MFAQQPTHRTLTLVASERNGQARTYRLSPNQSQQVAYRRLAVAILGLDVATLGDQLRSARRATFANVAA
jgi:hypothetical protein